MLHTLRGRNLHARARSRSFAIRLRIRPENALNSLGLCRERQSPRLVYRGLLQIFGFDYLTRRFQSPPEPPLVRGPSHLP